MCPLPTPYGCPFLLFRSWFGHADAWLHVALTTVLLALAFSACRALAAAGQALQRPKRDTPTT